MKVRVAYTTTVDDDYRRSINQFYGKPGLATRAEVRSWLHRYGTSEDDNLAFESSLGEEEDDG